MKTPQNHVQSEDKIGMKKKLDILDVFCVLFVALMIFLFIWIVVPYMREIMYTTCKQIPYFCYY